MSYNFTYNPDAMSEAILCSSKAIATYDSITKLIDDIKGKIDIAELLNKDVSNVMNKITTVTDALSGINYELNKIQLINEGAGVVDGFSNLNDYMSFVSNLAQNAGKQAFFIDSNYAKILGLPYPGYISVPSDYTIFSNYPLIVSLTGMGTDIPEYVKGIGLCAAAYNNPNCVNGIVYMPTNWQYNENRYHADQLQVSIDKVVNMVGADKDRISLIGHSLGGFAVLDLVANNPGYYAAAVEDGACCWNYHSDGTYDETIQKIAQSGTVLIKVESTGDDSVSQYTDLDYNNIKNAGGKVVLYEVQGGDHNTSARCQNQVLVNDVLNINKNNSYDLPNEKIIVTNSHDVTDEYIENKENYMGSMTSSKWYQKITDGTYVAPTNGNQQLPVVENPADKSQLPADQNSQLPADQNYNPSSGSNYYSGSYGNNSADIVEVKNDPIEVKNNTYILTIKYVYQYNPGIVVNTESKSIKSGEAYNYISTSKSYYNAIPNNITGVMPEGNIEVVVTYVPINDTNGNGKADEEEHLIFDTPKVKDNIVEEVKTESFNNTVDDTVKETSTINNYYYSNSSDNSDSYFKKSASKSIVESYEESDINFDVESLAETSIEPDMIESDIELIDESTIDSDMNFDIEPIIESTDVENIPEIHLMASPNLEPVNDKKNIWPAVGITTGVVAAIAGTKAIIDKSKNNNNNDDEYITNEE